MADKIEFLITAQNATKAAFNEVAGDLDGLAGNMAKTAAVAGTVLVAIGALANKFGEMADELHTNSIILDVNAQTLREWQHFAADANISGDQLVTALEKLSKNAGEAARGNKPLIDSFAAVGISQEELAGQFSNLEQLFPAVLEGIRNLGTGYTQVTSTTDLLGRSAAGFVAIVRDTPDALEKSTQALREQAGVLSNEEVKALADAKDAWDRLLRTIGEEGLTIVAKMTVAFQNWVATAELDRLKRELIDLQDQLKEESDPSIIDTWTQIWASISGGVAGGQGAALAAKAELDAIKAEIAKKTAEIAAEQARLQGEKPAPSERGGGGAVPGGVTDPLLADKIAQSQAAAETLRSLGELERINKQEQDRLLLDDQQGQVDESIKILEGWAIAEKIIRDKNAADEKKANTQKALNQAQYYLQVLAGASSYNKTFFEIAKVAAIANATIATYQGAAQALKDVPYPWNIAAAAAVIAAGVAQIGSIASTSFGGTATPTQSSGPGGFGTSFTPGQPTGPFVATPASSQQQGRIEIVVTSNDPLLDAFFQGASARINDQDGVLIRSDSRQAAEIRGR